MAESITSLLNILVEDFYPILGIITLLMMKHHRLGGVLLILLRCISGKFYWFHFSLVIMIAFFTNWLDPDYFVNKQKSKVGVEKDTQRKDPDYPTR